MNAAKGLMLKLQAAFDAVASRLAARSGFASALYYAFFSSAFRRETQAVLQGRRRYQQDIESPEESCALLRRNIHRLEKGLLMRPRRAVFALDYIEETLDCYARALHSAPAGTGHVRAVS